MKRGWIAILVCVVALSGVIPDNGYSCLYSYAQTTSKKKSKSKSKTKSKKSSKSKSKSTKKETSADVKKQEQQTQKEIKQTKQQIEENERKVKRSLAELNSIKGDIEIAEKQINLLSKRRATLNNQLEELNGQIKQNEEQLNKLRDKYLKVVKKMRLVRGNTDGLAFIFASESFSQAYRRLRYLREFSEWRKGQVESIAKLQEQLKTQHQLLSQTKAELDQLLAKEESVKKNLLVQQSQKDELVARLKENGVALESHLVKKQQEVNQLRNRISDLIIAEEKAAEERRRKEEAERRAAEQKAKEEAELQARKKAEEESKKTKEDKASKKEDKKDKDSKRTDSKKDKKQDKSYAEARKRKSRKEGDKSSSGEKAATKQSSFEKSKGSLPRPVSGQFKVVVPFGRHSLPDLPNVEYDNPGIDAEVSEGAFALAVYDGVVSGVYILKGFDTVVIINHGSYYTVYGNITSASVKVGDKVKLGQSLGKLYSDPSDNNRTMIHFEVWKGREKLDPMQWIK